MPPEKSPLSPGNGTPPFPDGFSDASVKWGNSWILEGQAVRYGQITLEKEQSARLLGWGIRFFLTAALTASRTPRRIRPLCSGLYCGGGPRSRRRRCAVGRTGGRGPVCGLRRCASLSGRRNFDSHRRNGLSGNPLPVRTAGYGPDGRGAILGCKRNLCTSISLPLGPPDPLPGGCRSDWCAAWFFIPLFQPRRPTRCQKGYCF